jgi:putative oxidoreductase
MKKLLSSGYNDTSFNIAALLLRISFGSLMFLNYGIPKLMHFEERSKTFYDPFHIGSQWSLLLVLFAEVFCSLLVVFGLFTRLALVPLITAMAVVVFMLNKGKPFSKSEMAAVFLTVFLGLILVGPGKFSVDAAMGR